MYTIKQTAVNNHFRVICEVGSMAYVVKGNTYKVVCKRASAIFSRVDDADIARMEQWIAYWGD